MSEEKMILGGTPFVEFEDAVEFLSARAPNKCPSCGSSKWSMTTALNGPNGIFAKGFVGVEVTSGEISTHGFPVITVTCQKCYYIRLHDFTRISKWIADGKPEYKDNE